MLIFPLYLSGDTCVENQAFVTRRFLVDEIVADRKRIARVDIFWVVTLGDLGANGPQDRAIALVCAKLNLPGSVRCQDFVESEIQFVIAKLIYQRRQLDSFAVANARLVRNCRERGDVDFSSG